MAGSYWLALIFQTSHVISEVLSYMERGGREREKYIYLYIYTILYRLNGQNLIKTMKFTWIGKLHYTVHAIQLCSIKWGGIKVEPIK